MQLTLNYTVKSVSPQIQQEDVEVCELCIMHTMRFIISLNAMA